MAKKYCKGVNMTIWDRIFAWLLIVGGLVHLVMAFNYDILDGIFGAMGILIVSNIIKGIVGFGALWMIWRTLMKFN